MNGEDNMLMFSKKTKNKGVCLKCLIFYVIPVKTGIQKLYKQNRFPLEFTPDENRGGNDKLVNNTFETASLEAGRIT